MKALIYNSGLGKRMGDLTKNNPKAMVRLKNGETIFERQLRILNELNITEIIVTTGPFKEQIEEVSKQKQFANTHFTFVENSDYENSNYIYSMYLAKDYLDDNMILLHGDLVFNRRLLQNILDSEYSSLVTINRKKQLPEKDFKGRIKDGRLQEVSINIFDNDCFALQPLYKLDYSTLNSWLEKTVEFIENGNNKVYAENAFNEILPNLNVREFSYENDYIEEVDNADDLERVSNEIRLFDFREQDVRKSINKVLDIISEVCASKVFIVSDRTMFNKWPLKKILDNNNIPYVLFTEYGVNPKFEDIIQGIKIFNNEHCDFIISLGGGSTIDTAKIIKLYSVLDYQKGPQDNYKFNCIKHLAIPTTAGTGSESTRFAVCYYDGKKQSITHDSIVPDYVVLEPELVMGLPIYQKKTTILDALCQAIESYWSVNSTSESKNYATQSIRLILKEVNDYISNNNLKITDKILYASNLAGKAINITQTTAAHAMSYKLTSLYGIAHGHAVALTLPTIWEYMLHNLDKCIDPRGKEYLSQTFSELNDIFASVKPYEMISDIFTEFELSIPQTNEEDLKILSLSVNPERLKNSPVRLETSDINDIYVRSLKYDKK